MVKGRFMLTLLIVVPPQGMVAASASGSRLCSDPLFLCEADIAPPGGDGFVNVDDLLAVINTWNADGNSTGIRPQGDCAPWPNGDCFVHVDDLIQVISLWGECYNAGACCLPDQSCIVTNDFACNLQGGTFKGGSCFATPLCPTAEANDDCKNAFLMQYNGPFGWINDFATTDGPSGEPGNGCEEFIARDLWYRKQDTCPNLTRIQLTNQQQVVRMIAVYDGWSCPPGELLGCAIGTGVLHVLVSLETNQPFTIRIGTSADEPHGEGYVSIFCASN